MNTNFLDVSSIKQNNIIIYDWYQKPTSSGRYLNYHSRHPLIHKEGIILRLTDRVLLLSYSTFYQKNFEKIIEILLHNGYPLKIFNFFLPLIKDYITKLDQLSNNVDNNNKYNNIAETQRRRFFTILFISHISEKIKYFLRKIHICRLTRVSTS